MRVELDENKIDWKKLTVLPDYFFRKSVLSPFSSVFSSVCTDSRLRCRSAIVKSLSNLEQGMRMRTITFHTAYSKHTVYNKFRNCSGLSRFVVVFIVQVSVSVSRYLVTSILLYSFAGRRRFVQVVY